MKIVLIEPFYVSSHKMWADSIKKYSEHEITILTLPGLHWKWRMHHAAIHFAEEVKKLKEKQDVILCTDFMDVAAFRGFLSTGSEDSNWYKHVLIGTFFHENQITYPWSDTDEDVALKRDNHYGWINFTTCLASDFTFFNSQYHKDNFIEALPSFLSQFPTDYSSKVMEIKGKSQIQNLGLEITKLSNLERKKNEVPTILWNHRWEYDKNPKSFFEALFKIQDEGLDFNVIIAGEKYKRYPEIFDKARQLLGQKVIHFGYAKSREAYDQLLSSSDIVLVTSNQDFFGISAIEAMAAGCYPILPKRLAFPEHLPSKIHNDHYYNSEDELLHLLRDVILQYPKPIDHIQKHLHKYEVSKQTKKFDILIQSFIER